MDILLESRAFHPSVGGLETSSELLATQWQALGHRVRVMTQTPLEDAAELDAFEVVRGPTPTEQFGLMRQCDAFVQSGISLRSLPVALAAGLSVLVTHRDFVQYDEPGWPGLPRVLKQWAARFLVQNIAVSRAVAQAGLPVHRTTVIHNAFRPVFDNEAARKRPIADREGLLFVGRLVTEKGCDVAIEALAHLKERSGNPPPFLTICGDGPERAPLETQVRQMNLEDYVSFAGVKEPAALAEEYAHAEVVLMPSRNEPFGNVAVEALACGAPVVAAEVGGLPEAVGPGGLLFPSGDAEAMAAQVAKAQTPETHARLLQGVEEHLAKHRIEYVAERYLQVLGKVGTKR